MPYALLILGLVAGGAGCRWQQAEAPAKEETQGNSGAASTPLDQAATAGRAEGATSGRGFVTDERIDREIWEVASLQGARVGYARTTIRRTRQGGQSLVLVEGTTHLAMRRFGKPMAVDMRFLSIETPDGRLVACESVIAQTSTTMVVRGRVAGGELQVETATAGKTTKAAIAWSPEDGGFYALQQSLARRPMKPGEKRTIRALEPGTSSISTTQLAARQPEPVTLLDKTVELLRIDTTTTLENHSFRGAVWTDRDGEIWKSWTDMLNLELVRATKEEALKASEPGELDFAWNVAIRVNRALQRPHATKRVRYRVRLEGGNPAEVFAAGPSQQVRSIDANTAEVTVFALRPGGPLGNPDAKDDPPTDNDRQPNNWIQSDNPEILAAAKEAAGDLKDPWEAAVALERYARGRIRRPGFSQAFDTAVDVLRSGEGDCTEHAVLLAALARARGIPARVAIGLVYDKQSYLYHMWTEMHLRGRWIPMDATLAQGGIGAAHLKLVHSNLTGASALSCFLPVAQVIGRMTIEIVDAE